MAAIVVVDSVTAADASAAGQVLVTGSHGGRIAAAYAARARVRGAAFNDAGCGLDDAGIAGLVPLADAGIAAFTVAHTSARIGDGRETLRRGRVSVANAIAARLGVTAGMACAEGAERLREAPWLQGVVAFPAEARVVLLAESPGLPAVIACDSIGLVQTGDAGSVLVIGSHGALHGGDPASALPVAARAAFFHDAGRGKDDAGVSRLPVLGARGIPAATADYRSARIGDAQSMWASGRLSVVNEPAARLGIAVGVALRAAAERLRGLGVRSG